MILEMFNTTMINGNNDVDSFPLSYEEDHFDSSSISLNRSFCEEILLNLNKTTSSIIFSFSSPFTILIFIIISYLILTIILLIFSLYKQRQTEIENFYFGDTEEDIEQGKRYLRWKQYLIQKIQKGDIKPLLTTENNPETFPVYIV